MSKSNHSFKTANANKQDDRSRILYEVPYNLSEIEKIDQDVLGLPSYVAVYVKEIFEYLQETQVFIGFFIYF